MTRANSSPASGAQSADSTNLPPLVVLQCAAVMFIGTMFFALLDSTSKFLSERYPVWEILFIRYAAHLFLFLIFLTATKRLKSSLRTARPKLQLLRSALLIFVNVMFFITLRYLPLAEAIAMIMLAPLFVALLAVPFLGETIGKHRIITILFGLLGAMIVFRPGSELFQPAALLALISAMSYALYQVMTRMLADSDSVATTTLYSALVGLVITGALAPLNLQPIAPNHIHLVLLLGLLAIFAHGAIIIAFTIAPASLATAFGYTSLFWSALFGLIFFGDFPDAMAWFGIAIIAASGVYLLWRETHHKLPPTPLQRLPVPLTQTQIRTRTQAQTQDDKETDTETDTDTR